PATSRVKAINPSVRFIDAVDNADRLALGNVERGSREVRARHPVLAVVKAPPAPAVIRLAIRLGAAAIAQRQIAGDDFLDAPLPEVRPSRQFDGEERGAGAVDDR